ncbi:unnamed protein product [Mesocestoides corti]|uniref:Helicase ATP-binding domain-containing protein n=1 Tax=Mesocestoides corti TaxID=53468 RepID=A0A0R3UED0_MESCO|nr:unnamed protein product [Mesocestoides corti]
MNETNRLSEWERQEVERKRLEALSRRQRSIGSAQPSNTKSFPSNVVYQDNRLQQRVGNQLRHPPTGHSFNPQPKTAFNTASQKRLGAPLPQTAAPPSKRLLLSKRPKFKVSCVLVDRDHFEVQANYHAGLMIVFKALPSRQYDSTSRKWRFLLSDYREFRKFRSLSLTDCCVVKKAAAIDDIQLEGLSSAVVSTFRQKIDGIKPPKEAEVRLEERLPKELIGSLMNFQRDGVSLALNRNGRILLADDMGLGKTLQGLAIAAAYRSEWPLLIVTPSSVRFAWREQAIRWLGGPLNLSRADINVVSSVRNFTADSDGVDSDTLHRKPITIFSYDLLSRCAGQMVHNLSFGVVIMDESHFLKNIKTSRTKAALPILKAAKRVILLTGTPALSRPVELYPQITAVQPFLFRGGFHEFGLRYCAAKENPWGWDYSGCSNMQELQIILEETIMTRWVDPFTSSTHQPRREHLLKRVKSEVLSQLPAKRREVVVLDPGLIKRSATFQRHHDLNLAAVDLKALDRHGDLLRYFMETCRVKQQAVGQYVSDLLEADRKFILFAHHQEMLDAMSSILESKSVGYIRIDGKTPSEQRSVVCERFQTEDNCKVALLSITAASTGEEAAATFPAALEPSY